MFKSLKNLLFRSSPKSPARKKSFQPMLECLEQREMMAANIVLVRPITANLTSNIALLQATQQSAQIISVVKQTADRLGAAQGPAAEPVSSTHAKPILAITSKVQPVPTILSTNINYKLTTQQSEKIISPLKKELDRAGAAKGSIADAALVQSKTASPVKVVVTPAIKVDVSKLQNLKENIHVYISESDLNALGLISRLPDAQAAAAAGNWRENLIFGDRGVQTAGRPGSSVGGVDFASAWTQPANPLSTSSLIMGNFAGDRSGHAQEEPPETQEQRNARWMANADEALGMVAAGATIVAFAATSPAWVTGATTVAFVAAGYYLGAHIAYVAHRNMEPNPDASSRGNVIYMTGRQFDEVVNRNDKTKEPTGEESSSSSSGPVNVVGNSHVGQWTSDMGGRVAATPGDARGLRARMESRINIITK